MTTLLRPETINKHLKHVIKPFPSKLSPEEENEITYFLDIPFQMDFPHSKVTSKEMIYLMKEINI